MSAKQIFLLIYHKLRKINFRRVFFCQPGILLLLLACSFPLLAESRPPLEKVSLQLKWVHQFQFAGYYAAKEKGFYAEEGLDVNIKQRIPKNNNIEQVLNGESEYGVADTELLKERLNGKPVVILASIFQHNALVYITLKSSGITNPYELKGKKVMDGAFERSPLQAMFYEAGISTQEFKHIDYSFNLADLINGKVDATAGYLTNEVGYFKQKKIPINIIDPRDYGVDFLGDNLFTTEQEIRLHPERTRRFLRASLKGWEYALKHPDEIIQLILHQYNPDKRLSAQHLRFEADETVKLILPDVIPIGNTSVKRFASIAHIYQQLSLVESTDRLEGFIYSQAEQRAVKFTLAELAWLKAHPVIRLGVDKDFAPYEWVDSAGNYRGLAADYINLIQKQLGVKFEIVKDKPWKEIEEMAKQGKVDMLAALNQTPKRDEFLYFTEPYADTASPDIIINHKKNGFIGNLERLNGKRVVVENGYLMQELISNRHPKIQLIPVKNTYAALKMVSNGEADAYVGDAVLANYTISKEGIEDLVFSGDTGYKSRHRMAATKANAILVSILTKALASIQESDRQAIESRWMGEQIKPGIKPETLIKYGAGVLVLLLLSAVWNMRLQREIKHRKQLDAALLESEDAFRHLFEDSADPILLIKNGCFIDCNTATVTLLGYSSKSKIISYRPERISPPYQPDGWGSKEKATQMIDTAFRVGYHRFEWLHIKADGSPFPVEVSLTSMTIRGEPIIHVCWRDITERKKAENALRESQERLQKIASRVPGMVFQFRASVDGYYSFPYCSDGIISIFGVSPEQVQHNAAALLARIHREDYDAVILSIQQSEHDLSPWICEFRACINDGVVRWVRGNSIPQREEDDSTLWHGFVTDITDSKQVEVELYQSKEIAVAASQAKGEFLANMSHEIRTPMNAIIGMTRLALRTELTAKQRNYLNKIDYAAQSLLSIINDILDFSKIEADKLELENITFSLDEVLRYLSDIIDIKAKQKNIVVVSLVNEKTPRWLVGDTLRLSQILINLVSNAVKFTEKGKIILSVTVDEQLHDAVRLRFSVQDSGIGMTTEQMAELFQPFSQADSSITRKYGGTGLGLVVSKKLVELMGGSISVESQLNKGSTFYFTVKLGIAQPPLQASDTAHIKAGQNSQELSPCLSGWKILLVEDNEINRELAIELLTDLGIEVEIAKNGHEGVQRVLAEQFDLVLMDIQMPVMDGLTACRLIRATPRFSELPIIAMTANAMARDREASLAAGMNDHITKPIDPEKLTAVLRHWLSTRLRQNTKPDQAPKLAAEKNPAVFIPDHLPPFDITAALVRVKNNRPLLHRLLLLFRNEYAEAMPNLKALILEKHYKEAKRLVHTIRGVAGNLEAAELAAAAAAVERAFDENEISSIEILIDRLDKALTSALQAANSLK